MFTPLVPWDSPAGQLIDGRYRLGRKLGSGAFAKVYEATDPHGNRVAVKMERAGRAYASLRTEHAVYLAAANNTRGIPRMHWYGQHAGYNVLVMDCLGPSLASYVDGYKGMSMKSTLMVGIQALNTLQVLHHHLNILHRDIKPDNMLIGLDDPNQIYIADFGLAGEFRDRWSGRHIPRRLDVGTVGTVEFSSSNSMEGKELSRRDDLESLGYTLVYLFNGKLPWTHVKAHGLHALQRKVGEYKRRVQLRELCHGLPREMAEYFKYVRGLAFAETPNYSYLRRLFRSALQRHGYGIDETFDWVVATSEVTDEFPGSSQDSSGSSAHDRAIKLEKPLRDAERGFAHRAGRKWHEKVAGGRRHGEKQRDRDAERERERAGRRHGDKSPRKSTAARPRRRTSEKGRRASEKGRRASEKGRRKSTAKLVRSKTAKAGELGRRNSPRDGRRSSREWNKR